jgi:hypothetical protein
MAKMVHYLLICYLFSVFYSSLDFEVLYDSSSNSKSWTGPATIARIEVITFEAAFATFDSEPPHCSLKSLCLVPVCFISCLLRAQEVFHICRMP